MHNIESHTLHTDTKLARNNASRVSKLSRTALAALTLIVSGCDIAVRPPSNSQTQSAPSPERSEELAEMDSKLSALQSELYSYDRQMSAEIAALRIELQSKVDIAQARALVEKELSRMQIRERLQKVSGRTGAIEQRLNALEEHFGILPRVPEAPWVQQNADND